MNMVVGKKTMMRRVLKHYYEKERAEYIATNKSKAAYPEFNDSWIENKFKDITGLEGVLD